MSLFVEDLSKEELRNLMKPLSIELLRQPIIENKKLEKKYITGFRPTSVTYVQLVPMYFQELRLANKDVKKALLSSINSYLEECNMVEKIENFIIKHEWNDCVEIGIELGNCMCKVSFELIVKMFRIDLDEEKVHTVSVISSQIYEQRTKIDETCDNYEKEKLSYISQIDRLNREMDKNDGKKNSAIKQREEVEKELRQSESEASRIQLELDSLHTLYKEQNAELTRNVNTILEQEKSLGVYKRIIEENKIAIRELEESINELSKQLELTNNAKVDEYDAAIERLVTDTIDDLQVSYSLDSMQFDNIINGIDGEHDILLIWDKISEINIGIMQDVEASMRVNKIDVSVLDHCDEVENNILVQYIMLKAIKSLYFEYLARNEKNRAITDKIRVQ